MAKNKQQKEKTLDDLKEKFSNIKSAVFVNFSGIGVQEIDDLRIKAKENGAEYLVTKKTLLKKALEESDYGDEVGLSGEVATVFGFGDDVTPAKLTSDFAKTNENFKILGGILEGNIIDVQKVQTLAKLLSRDELIAKVVRSIAAPLSGMVNVLQGNLRNFVYVLNAVKEKKS